MHKFLADLTPKVFLIFSSLVVLLVIAPLVSYIAIPSYKSYASTHSSFLTLSNNFKVNGDNQEQMKTIQIQISQLQSQLNGDGVQLPFKQFESHVIGQLQQLAWNNTIELAGVRPRFGQMIDRYHEVIFDINLTGDFFDLYKFLLDFEKSMGLMVINKFKISAETSNGESPLIRAELSIASYREELP